MYLYIYTIRVGILIVSTKGIVTKYLFCFHIFFPFLLYKYVYCLHNTPAGTQIILTHVAAGISFAELILFPPSRGGNPTGSNV